jgi:hypothetical protein
MRTGPSNSAAPGVDLAKDEILRSDIGKNGYPYQVADGCQHISQQSRPVGAMQNYRPNKRR